MQPHKTEKGQALVLITFAIIGLIAITGLVVDGGLTFAKNRSAQNAADAAAYAAALAKIRGNSITLAAEDSALTNGFESTQVTINNPPASGCGGENDSHAGDDDYIQVIINTQVETYFAKIVGIEEVHTCVEAVTFIEPPTIVPLFKGNAIVGLNPTQSSHGSYPCGFDSGKSNAVSWHLVGGGIFSNGCAYAKNFGSVNLDENPNGDPTQCVNTVGPASNFKCAQQNQGPSIAFTAKEIGALMPPKPPCDNTAKGGFLVPSNPASFIFSNGLYCVSNFDAFNQQDIVLDNATLYITDTAFDVKFAGHGGFAGSAPMSGNTPYKGYYLVIAMSDTPCERYQNGPQSLEFRGNGVSDIVGTIMAPTICLDFRGNSNGYQVRSQIVGYTVSSNGTSTMYINYDSEENGKTPKPPTIQLVK